jgi:hypothetical protein
MQQMEIFERSNIQQRFAFQLQANSLVVHVYEADFPKLIQNPVLDTSGSPTSIGFCSQREHVPTCCADVLFLSQRLCRIDSCNSQSWYSGGNERHSSKHQDDHEDCGHVIDADAIEHTAHSTQCSCT